MNAEKCTMCRKATGQRCSTCHSTYYCSAECQKRDWPLHKLLCKNYATFLSTRPSPRTEGETNITSHLALFLPKNDNLPQLVWVEARPNPEQGGEPEVKTFLHGTYMNLPSEMDWNQHGHHLQYLAGGNSYVEDDENECYRYLNTGYSPRDPGVRVLFGPPCGNIVVCSLSLTDVDFEFYDPNMTYIDITLADLRYTLNQFTAANTIFESDVPNKFVLPYQVPYHAPWIKAVKVSCSGDMKFMGKKRYREVIISEHHEIYGPLSIDFFGLANRPEVFQSTGKFRREGDPDLSPDISTISQHMGITLRAKRMPYDPSWAGRTSLAGMYDNFDPVLLMTETTMENENDCWGAAMPKFNIGQEHTMLFARDDKKDITVHQVEALISYVTDVFLESEEMLTGAGAHSREAREEIVAKYLTSSRFDEFFEEMKREKIREGDESWVGEVSPCTI